MREEGTTVPFGMIFLVIPNGAWSLPERPLLALRAGRFSGGHEVSRRRTQADGRRGRVTVRVPGGAFQLASAPA
jgi:hypothetical protein